ncbi:serine-threonine/tyrosine-protein kinase catalytic domain-containing protein [Tanacetum coccineum]
MLKTHFDAISERVGGVFERGTDETRMIETQRLNNSRKRNEKDDLRRSNNEDFNVPLKAGDLDRNSEEENCHGGYGVVYKGVLSINGKDTTVAVKRLDMQFGQGLKEFLTEIQLLSGQEHPNLISLLGYCNHGKEKILVYEYAARGSLDSYIRRNSSTNLTWLGRLKICADAARGLDHLHNHLGRHRMIIHRDIKSSNILIDENWVAKISDLGLSKLGVTGFGMSDIVTNGCGTHGYCEPEYFNTAVVTKKSDVYSFGIVLFEVLCGRLCLTGSDGFILSEKSVKDYYNRGNLVKIIDPNLREHMGSYSITKFSEIAYRCLHEDRQRRPAMDIVVKELEEVLVAHGLEEKRKYHVVDDSDSDEYWETKLPRDWEALINMFNIPSDTCSSKKKLVSHLREGLHFDKDKQFISINDDGKKCVTISARKFLACKESLFQRSLRFLKLAGYPNCRYLQGTKCRIEVSMLSVGTMYAASLMFKYRWKRDENLIPKKLITIKWTMEELSVYSTHYAELISENWYKIRMWHFMNHGLIATFDFVLEELSYFRKTDKSDILIKGIEFEPHEKNEEDIDDVDDDKYWEKKLPDEYQRYIEMSDKPFDCTTKKELYLSLSQGFLGCNGQLWFSLCKSTSGMCLILPATHILRHYKDLKTLSLSESRFKEVVRLETRNTNSFSCRLGSFMFSPQYTYACYLVFKYEDNQVVSNDASFYKAECTLGDNNMIQGTLFAHLTSVNIPAVFTDSSKSIATPNKDDMDLEHSFVEKKNDGWMQVRLTKPLHQLENHESLKINLVEPNSSSMGIIVEGVEFRPVIHDGSYVTAVRSANLSIIGTTYLHDDHDKNEENTDEYWEKKLPHNYPHLIEMSDIPLNYTTKKELYFLFRHGFLANNGQLWLLTCKSTRGICSILPARCVLSEDSSYNELQTLSLPKSRFKEVKKLGSHSYYVFTCRLESFMFSPGNYNYACYLVFKLEDGYVLSNDGSIFEAKYNLGGNSITTIPIRQKKPKEESGPSKSIDGGPGMSKYNYVDSETSWVEKRDDGWLEARLTKPLSLKHHHLKIRYMVVQLKVEKRDDGCLNGMIVEGIEFRPVGVDGSYVVETSIS